MFKYLYAISIVFKLSSFGKPLIIHRIRFVLTLLSTLQNVSVYSVYYLVVNGVKQIVYSMTSGMQAMLGNMLAKNEMKELNKAFENFEWTMHTLVTFVFSCTAILIVPFVRVYTADITDANYILLSIPMLFLGIFLFLNRVYLFLLFLIFLLFLLL